MNLDTNWHEIAIDIQNGKEDSKISKESLALVQSSSRHKPVYNKSLVSIEKEIF